MTAKEGVNYFLRFSIFRDDEEENYGCPDKGNLTRLCTEKCKVDGLTCITEVDIDACTCAGRKMKLHEIAVYDMSK